MRSQIYSSLNSDETTIMILPLANTGKVADMKKKTATSLIKILYQWKYEWKIDLNSLWYMYLKQSKAFPNTMTIGETQYIDTNRILIV